MPFGIIGRRGPGMRQVVGFGDRSTRRGTFGGEFGARHCNQWGLYGYVCDSAATRPSSQITLRRLIIIIIERQTDIGPYTQTNALHWTDNDVREHNYTRDVYFEKRGLQKSRSTDYKVPATRATLLCQRGLGSRNSVRLFVCPSVRHTHAL